MITYEEAVSFHDRVMWDDRPEPRRTLEVPGLGSGLVSVLDEGMGQFEKGEVQLIILPWEWASTLLTVAREAFWENPDSPLFSLLRVLPDHGKPALYGYVATYRGVDMFATTMTDYGWVLSTREPREMVRDRVVLLQRPRP